MVQMKQHQSPASAHAALPALGHSASSPSSASSLASPLAGLSPSPSSAKRLRLNHGSSFTYSTPHSSPSSSSPPFALSSSSASPTLSYAFDPSQMPASLAPSSIHRQHSSGTGQVLESSLFDLPSSGAWIPSAYPLQHSDSLSHVAFPQSHAAAASPPNASDDDFAQSAGASSAGLLPHGSMGVRKLLATPTFAAHGQPGFDSLSPSVSSPPQHLQQLSGLHASPLHQVYGDFSFSHPASHFDDLTATSIPPYGRDQSYIAFPMTASQELGGGLDASGYDYASPSHAQQLPIGSLARMSSEDAQLSASAAADAAGQRTALDFASAPSSSASSVASAVHPPSHYPHVVPPSHKVASASLPSSPASTPSSTPRSPHVQAQPRHSSSTSSSRKRHRRSAGDEDGDEKASVSSGASAQSQSSSSKDRHVNTAVKLVTSNDESGEFLMDTKVKQIFYPRPDWPKPHRIRLIEVEDLKTGRRSVYAHGADVGSVVERKSNISRLFGKFTSPNEKLLMNVPGPHNHTVGQESNILTEMGIRRFLDTNKMKGQDHYRHWIVQHLIPRLSNGEQQQQQHSSDDQQQQQQPQQQPQQHTQALLKREQHSLGHLAAPQHRVGVNAGAGVGAYGATDSPQSLPSSPQSYTSYSSDSYHSSH